MTMMNTQTPTEMLPPPANGDGSKSVSPAVVSAAAAGIDAELAKKLEAIQNLGKQIKNAGKK